MITCRDCIHYDVCGFEWCDSEALTFCKDFKDKSRIIELPCKVGETVHYITFWKNEYNYHFITNVSYDILHQLLHEKEIVYVIYMTDDKSKAEAKLKELNGNG